MFFLDFKSHGRTAGLLCQGISVGDATITRGLFSKALPALAWLRGGSTPGKQVLQRRFFGWLLLQLHPQTRGYMPLLGLLCHEYSNDVDLVQATRAKVYSATVIYMN